MVQSLIRSDRRLTDAVSINDRGDEHVDPPSLKAARGADKFGAEVTLEPERRSLRIRTSEVNV
jgi:hypothetical protein